MNRKLMIDRALNDAYKERVISKEEKLDLMALGFKNYSLFERTIKALGLTRFMPRMANEFPIENTSNEIDSMVAEYITEEAAAIKYAQIMDDEEALAKLSNETPKLYNRCITAYYNQKEAKNGIFDQAYEAELLGELPEQQTFAWLQENDPEKLRKIERDDPDKFEELLDEYENSLL